MVLHGNPRSFWTFKGLRLLAAASFRRALLPLANATLFIFGGCAISVHIDEGKNDESKLAGHEEPSRIMEAEFDESRVIDLTYPFNETTIYWPTATKFELKRVAYGYDPSGKWYASNDFSASEHGGTHLDAPIHFAEGGRHTAEIPVSQLMGLARVLDIRGPCERDRDYLLSPEDIEAHEARYGPIEPGSVVFVLTGFGTSYPDARRYLGSDVRGSAENLHFPGIGEEAARLLVKRRIDLVGIDTASLDHGPSKDFTAHRVFAAANIPGIENVARLEKLPPRGAWVIALPMKIENGTGGPCRAIAVLP